MWTNGVYNSVYDKLNLVDNLSIYTEFLDAKLFRDTSYYPSFTQYLLEKYKEKDFEVIVTTDNAAIDYIIAHQYIKKFRTPYKVYSGVSDLENYTYLGKSYFGIYENFLIRERLEIIDQMLPNLEVVYVAINRNINMHEMIKAINEGKHSFKVEILADYEPEELYKIANNPPTLNAAMLIYGISYDRKNKTLDRDKVIKKISELSKIPISPTSKSNIGKANIGGIFESEEDHGLIIANIVKQILDKRDIYSIPKFSIAKSEIIFDYNSLKKFKINFNNLPQNAKIINTPQKIFIQYRREVIIITILILLLVLVIGVLYYNITKRRRTEVSLNRSEKRFQDIVQMLPQTVFENDLSGNISFVNKKGLELFGYSEQDLKKGINLFSLFDPGEHALMRQNLKKLITHSTSDGNTYIAIKRDGTRFPLQMHTVVIYEFNKPHVIRGIAIDVTKIKEIEQKLVEARIKAEESNNMKSAFLSNLSHEIRTPLNAIVGFSSLLAEENKTLAEVAEYNRMIQSSSNYLLTLINDIIDYSKIEAGQIDISLSNVNINNLMDELLLQFEKELMLQDKNNISLKFENKSTKEFYMALTDKVRLKQIISNLLDNAIKFTDEGSIVFGLIPLSNDKLQFYVKDTGPGINAENLKIIFDRFYKLSQNTTKLYRGSGLGLSISKNLVNLMGGDIWAESEPNVGSKFIFTIHCKYQIVQKQSDVIAANSKIDFDFKDKTILIAEDESSNFEFIRIILNATGAKIVRAENGLEAVKLVNKQHIDLIIMDIQMPVMNGYDAIKKIKATNPNLHIIAQTAYAMTGDKEKILTSGCDDYIAKPINKNNLLRLIDAYLGAV